MTSTLQSSRLGSTFFAEISGLELSQKPTAETMLWLSRALVEHKVLLFRNQQLTTDQYARFGRQWTGSTRIDGFTEMNVAPYDDINRVGNDGALFENEDYRNGAAFWHTDCAAEPDPDATTMLYCIHAMAEGGETVFADMQAAYEQLDTETQRNIAELSGLHCYAGAKQILGEKDAWEHNLTPVTEATQVALPDPIKRPLVRRHSITGKYSLYGPAGSMFAIENMQLEAANSLMGKLKTHATEERFCYAHKYQPGDLVMWDNSCLIHHASKVGAPRNSDDKRLMYRICATGVPASLA